MERDWEQEEGGVAFSALQNLTDDGNPHCDCARPIEEVLAIVDNFILCSPQMIDEAWQYLADTKLAWKVGGQYGQRADLLIRAGIIQP